MLKNKWLALGLSLLAITLVVYRVFFDKEVALPPPGSSQPLVQVLDETETDAMAAPDPDLEWIDPSGELLIDSESPLLLQRVRPSLETKKPYEPLSTRFGPDIFVRRQTEAAEVGSAEAPAFEALELNGIVIDEARRLAIVNRQLVKEGEYVGAVLIVSILPGRVLCRHNGTDIVLESTLIPVKRLK